MSYIKNYMFDLAEKLGREDVNSITSEDMERDFQDKAQEVWRNPKSTDKEKSECKQFLPKISMNLIGNNLVNASIVNGILYDKDGFYYLITY